MLLCGDSVFCANHSYPHSAGMEYRCELCARILCSSHTLIWTLAGINLLELPQEVLHAICSHIKAHEWAQGPAQSCRLMSRMDLPRLTLQIRVGALPALFKAPRLSDRSLCLCKRLID